MAAFVFSKFKICDRHYLLLCKCLQLIGKKPAIVAIYMKQLQDIESDHLSLLKVVQNNQEWFVDDLLFSIVSTNTMKGDGICYRVLVADMAGALGQKSTSLSVLGDQYKEPLNQQKLTRK